MSYSTLKHLQGVLLLSGFCLLSISVPSVFSEEVVEGTTPISVYTSVKKVAVELDRMIEQELNQTKTPLAPLSTDEDFLRRITLDLTGTIPSPREVTLFGLDSDPQKRVKLIEKLIASEEYAKNWSRYWRDVIFSRVTEARSRIGLPTFEDWMTKQLQENKPWDEIATSIITATGDVRQEGATGLIFAQGGEASAVASEVSRIFLGIQIQCADCHDHPSDKWKREDFHQLAAFFPRIRVRPVQMDKGRSFEVVSFDNSRGARGNIFQSNPRALFFRFDRNKDGKISKAEVKGSQLERPFERILASFDGNSDGALNMEEVKKVTLPMQRNNEVEHFMPDLDNPAARGKKMEPLLFVSTEVEVDSNLKDLDRRGELASQMTSRKNPWFAKAYVNRIWSELTGEGFYMPIDDMGPERSAQFPKALEFLSKGFVANDYDTQWLLKVITNSETYQRSLGVKKSQDDSSFACATATRLRGDQLFGSLGSIFGIGSESQGRNPRFQLASPRAQFNNLFGFDPSTPQADITGDIPQALFMMNSPLLNQAIRGTGNTRLAALLQKYDNDEDALAELYLLVLSREPSEKERKICQKFISKVDSRTEAYEDIMWSLLNSSEFLSKR